ncbi:MAG: glycosyltransferase family 9 protein [Muribaculaceae bacterium]|nr:glycosyltransferase family 9 protein [Muribaculaceae bacterium]
MSKKVLILRLSALGDVAMTLPVIYSVARQFPDVEFTLLTRPFFRRLFINPPANLRFEDFADPAFSGLLKTIARLRAEKFSDVADLHDMLRTRLIRRSVGAGRVAVVDKARSRRKELTRHKSRSYQPSYIERYRRVFAALGLPAELTFTSIFGHDADRVRSGVGIAPFARYQTKTYPPELMEKVVRLLTDRNIPVYLFGARGAEAEELARWAERNPALNVLAGTLTLEEELERMSRLRLMVSMDSANMHLASLVATPVVSIWGSTIPQCGFMGYRQNPANAIWLDLPCQPCSVAGLPECPLGTCACLRDLSPQTVASKIITNY